MLNMGQKKSRDKNFAHESRHMAEKAKFLALQYQTHTLFLRYNIMVSNYLVRGEEQ